ncbi:MAG: type IV pilin protein [Sandaracinaceae bacterium]
MTRRRAGYTMIELLMVVAMVGILAALAVPVFNGYRYRSRVSEAVTFLADIRQRQEAYRSEFGRYCSVSGPPTALGTWAPTTAPNPPGRALVEWDYSGGAWNQLGAAPDGFVRFQYRTVAGLPTEATPAPVGYDGSDFWYIAQARADLDGDGQLMIMEAYSAASHIFIGDASMNMLSQGYE